MMPPDDRTIPVTPTEPVVPGAAGSGGPGPAAPAPDAVARWFDLETIVELSAPITGFADAAGAAAQYRRASRAENTRRAYRAAVARFCDWCATNRQNALPAAPETVAPFLAAEARAGLGHPLDLHLAALEQPFVILLQQEIAVAALLQQLDERHSLFGHRVLGQFG